MKPYYSETGIDLYLGDNREVLAQLGVKPEEVGLLWGDPPYGVNEDTDRTGRGMSSVGRDGPSTLHGPPWRSRCWLPVIGDDQPFDPAPWLSYPYAVFWGANHYASRLPDSAAWWVWDKSGGGVHINANSDAELAWVRGPNAPVRVFTHLWKGLCTASEAGGVARVHPTQKPEALATWGFQRSKLKPGDLVLSPWLGSGPEAAAAKRLGLRFIGIELVPEYLDACVARLRQGVLDLAPAEPRPELSPSQTALEGT